MKVNVVVRATQITEYTYEVSGVNSIETAQKCAMRAANRQYQPNAWMSHKVPYPPTLSVHSCEVAEIN